MARKEKHEKEPSPPQAHKDINDIIAAEIEEDKEYWLGVVNVHLENLLKKANRNTTMQRNMARHYYARNMVCKVRVNNMEKKLKKTLRKLKNKDIMDLIVDASLVA